jgi:hypothetical protein
VETQEFLKKEASKRPGKKMLESEINNFAKGLMSPLRKCFGPGTGWIEGNCEGVKQYEDLYREVILSWSERLRYLLDSDDVLADCDKVSGPRYHEQQIEDVCYLSH